jgi:magnesium transporter
VTLRYVEPQSFKNFSLRGQKVPAKGNMAEALLSGLLGAFINRMADIVEKVDRQIDTVSQQVFKSKVRNGRSSTLHFQRIIKELGLAGDLISKTQESLVSIQRLVTFLLPNLDTPARRTVEQRLNFIIRDVGALREHSSYLIDKINFLLDATLGLINIQQNDIMKLFSIAAVCFMPGTLITGFFGMNFEHMPMLHYTYGYEFSFVAIIASLIIPFLMFRWKGWL